MVYLLLFAFPIFIAYSVHMHITGKLKKIEDSIIIFGNYMCIINLLTLMVVKIYSKTDFYLDVNIYRLAFIVKYMLVNCLFACVVPVIALFISKNFQLKLGFKKNSEKKSKK